MAGDGKRFGSDTPKQFHRLSGKKVYLHTLESFVRSKLFDEVLLVCHSAWTGMVEEEIASLQGHCPIRVIAGGSSRQKSSYLGLTACNPQTRYVVIHDAVRPFVSEEILRKNVEMLRHHPAVDTCIPSADTMVYSEDRHTIHAIPHRAQFLRGQTPQSFSYPMILEAHRRAEELHIEDATDDCQIALRMGHAVHIAMGDERNIKITSNLDLFLAEQLLRTSPLEIPLSSGSLKGGVFLITGGTGGIGQAIAKKVRREGGEVIEISRSSTPFFADLTHPDAAAAIFEAIHKRYGQVDGLINCIGYLALGTLQQLEIDEIHKLIDTNLHSVIYCCRFAAIRPGGHIVNIASSSYARGRPYYAIYSAAKAAVVNFTQGLAEERSDLCVNVVVPPRTNTAMRRSSFPQEDPSLLLEPSSVADSIVNILKQKKLTGTIFNI